MDLGLEVNRTSGRAAKPLAATVIRDLRQEDLALLATEKGVKAPALQKLRDSHHAVARLLAEGKRPHEVQLITGYSASRISILQDDPAFQELTTFYKTKVDEVRDAEFVNMSAKLASLNSDAIDELSDRLNEAPEKFANAELLDVVKATSDRTGLGPKSTQVNVNLDLAARIQAGRQRVARLAQVPILPADGLTPSVPIEGEVVGRTPPSPPLAQEIITEAEIVEEGK